MPALRDIAKAAFCIAPGRLGSPTLGPGTDPRTRTDLLPGLTSLQIDGIAPPPEVPLGRGDDPAAIAEALAATDASFSIIYENFPLELPGDNTASNLTIIDETIQGPDSNDLHIRVIRPSDTTGPLPGVLYIHGGGMVILATRNPVHDIWCEDLAHAGAVAIQVDFRNGPFPMGLNDCAAVIRWVHANRNRLGLASLILQGESGGGNLAIASALKAKREGWADAIDGVYASVPYISGAYDWPEEQMLAELPSLVENNGYLLDTAAMTILMAGYDPIGEHAKDPLAWPYAASVGDLRGLPPHVIAINELDPLRDEGVAFARRLVEAGVKTTNHIKLGIIHGAELLFRQAIPEVREFAVADIMRFAKSVAV